MQDRMKKFTSHHFYGCVKVRYSGEKYASVPESTGALFLYVRN